MVTYHNDKGLLLVPFQAQLNLFYTSTSPLKSVLILSSHLCSGLSNGVPVYLSEQNFAFLVEFTQFIKICY